MKVLLTGGTGMLARNISEEWTKIGSPHELVTIGRSTVDLRDRAATLSYIKELAPDKIIHAAARVGGISANMADPSGFLMDNLLLDTSLLSSARECGVRDFLYIGSSCMYPRNYRQPLVETDLLAAPLEPTNEGYALSKITAAKFCEFASSQFGLNYKVIVPSNLYGRHDHYNSSASHLVAAALSKAHAAKVDGSGEVIVWGTGNVRREFTYVADLAKWIVASVDSISEWPSLMNVGLGTDNTVREIYETALQVVGFNGSLTYDTSKPEGMQQKLMDSSLAHNFGWNPTTSLFDGMTKSYDQLAALNN